MAEIRNLQKHEISLLMSFTGVPFKRLPKNTSDQIPNACASVSRSYVNCPLEQKHSGLHPSDFKKVFIFLLQISYIIKYYVTWHFRSNLNFKEYSIITNNLLHLISSANNQVTSFHVSPCELYD